MEESPIEAFANQVGGHTFELQNQGMLHQGNCILKQLQDMGRGYYYYVKFYDYRDKEVTFYETINSQYPEFSKWIAGYHGIKEVDTNGIKGRFMILDDLTAGYCKPSVIDLKIGTKTWEDDAPQEKIDRESKKYPIQRKIGFRLTGMRVFNRQTEQYDIYDKKFGYQQTEESLNSMFAIYFSQVDEEKRKDVIGSIITDLKPLLAWFETPGHMKFICSSILFIFEGNTKEDYRPIVKLVDFAHVKQLPPTERDEGCIVGIKRILSELESLYEKIFYV